MNESRGLAKLTFTIEPSRTDKPKGTTSARFFVLEVEFSDGAFAQTRASTSKDVLSSDGILDLIRPLLIQLERAKDEE